MIDKDEMIKWMPGIMGVVTIGVTGLVLGGAIIIIAAIV